MAKPKNFGFGEEEQMLRDAARKFFASELPPERLHKLVAAEPDPNRPAPCHWEPQLWHRIVELGWTAVAVPERAGGVGMPAVAVVALAEEVGRAAFPSPFISTVNASYVLSACENDGADRYLEQIVDGKAFSLATTAQDGNWLNSGAACRVRDGKLSGTAWYVQEAAKADYFLVSAQQQAGAALGLYVVPRDAPGLKVLPDAIVDLTRDQARVQFDDVAIDDEQVLSESQGFDILCRSEPALLVAIAADICGAAEWQLQTTSEYAREREQFGHPIGFFQAVKHPLVEMMMLIDQARSLVYDAACTFEHEPHKAEAAARMAKSAASDAAVYCSSRSIQLHGGMGFTWESYLHLYFKRQMHNSQLLGDGKYHRALLAQHLIEPRDTE